VEPQDIARFVGALVLVLGLIALAGFVARRLGLGGAGPTRGGRARRLSVTESIALDPKRRLVLVRLDRLEHLLLLGPAGDLLVERSIAAEPFAAPPMDAPPPGARQEPSL
jgi:flagellar biogenesis protein FliO